MIRLHNDYNRGACAKILEKLAETNAESYDGYGEDTWCEKAADLIRKNAKLRKQLFISSQVQPRQTLLSMQQR